MKTAFPWVAFWAVVGLYIWCEHQQYMAGHDTFFWSHENTVELQRKCTEIEQ